MSYFIGGVAARAIRNLPDARTRSMSVMNNFFWRLESFWMNTQTKNLHPIHDKTLHSRRTLPPTPLPPAPRSTLCGAERFRRRPARVLPRLPELHRARPDRKLQTAQRLPDVLPHARAECASERTRSVTSQKETEAHPQQYGLIPK
jgi:hypothetical protein